jgi:hypothetical protein
MYTGNLDLHSRPSGSTASRWAIIERIYMSNKHQFIFPKIPKYWENFVISILLHLLLPLLPLFFELIQNHYIGEKSLVLAASMYTITIGITSRSRIMFAITIISSVAFAFLYGIAVGNIIPTNYGIYAIIGILFTFVIHCCERYNRHVIDRSPFLQFVQD